MGGLGEKGSTHNFVRGSRDGLLPTAPYSDGGDAVRIGIHSSKEQTLQVVRGGRQTFV